MPGKAVSGGQEAIASSRFEPGRLVPARAGGGPPRSTLAFLAVSLLAAPLVVVCLFSACSRGAPEPVAEEPEGFIVPAGGSLVLFLDQSGAFGPLAEPAGSEARAPGSEGSVPVPFPVASAPSAIQPFGAQAIIAVNRKGLYALSVEAATAEPSAQAAKAAKAPDPSAGRAASRVRIGPISDAAGEFAGRTVSGSWARGEEAYFLLYRHPVWETEAPRDPPSAVIRASGGTASASDIPIGADAYAVYPRSPGGWLVQTRSADGERVVTSYSRYDPESRSSVPLSRKEFERLAQPEPLSEAPAPLPAAAAALAGPLLVELRLPDGSRRTFVRGDPGEAAPAWGQVAELAGGGASAVLAADDWRVAVAVSKAGGGSSAVTFRRGPPLENARVRDAALVGGLVVLAWEEDLFPDVGAGGLVLIDPGL